MSQQKILKRIRFLILLVPFFRSDSRKAKVTIMTLLLSAFSTTIFIVRAFYTDDLYYGFLVWNLFLAWIPYIFSFVAYKNYFLGGKKIRVIIAASVWLLFFPNAPYIITDLVHIEARNGIPIWFDAVLVYCFALTGFILGLASLYFIHRILEHRFSKWLCWIMIFFLIVMSGYGIYIGRILRWNSWDVFTNTFTMMHQVRNSFFSTSSLAMMALFSVLMGITYPFLFYFVRSVNKK